LKDLPLTKTIFKNDTEIIAGCYDGNPVLLTINKDGKLEFTRNISEGVNVKTEMTKSRVSVMAENFSKRNEKSSV